ncbi:MAG TPA: phosphoribosylglycinamide formyltransferase [Candidatus Peribacterales bacterium]|nr:phosphoribosylglycinamide formyltransferase [Candidatus Peribacterales bacterium]
MRFVVLSSSRGTTFQAILNAITDGSLTAQCLGLVTDRPDRGCIEKAQAAGVPVVVVPKRAGESREEYDDRLDAAIRSLGNVDIIAAIGWMFVLTSSFIARWHRNILNVHPALLPKYGGREMYGEKVHAAVLKSGERESGMTIHLMDEGVDTGRILLQKRCPVLSEDTPEILKTRVQELEKEWYPKVLQMIERGELLL